MGNRKRTRIGDIIEIRTSKGFGYCQYTWSDPALGAMIRILPGVFVAPPSDFKALAAAKELYFVYFPLSAAVSRGLVRIVDTMPVPSGSERPTRMKRPIGVSREGRVTSWAILEDGQQRIASSLDEEERKLSLSVIWNDTLLAERIAQNWTPESEVENSN